LECGDSFAAFVFALLFVLSLTLSASQTKNKSGEGIAALQTKPRSAGASRLNGEVTGLHGIGFNLRKAFSAAARTSF